MGAGSSIHVPDSVLKKGKNAFCAILGQKQFCGFLEAGISLIPQTLPRPRSLLLPDIYIWLIEVAKSKEIRDWLNNIKEDQDVVAALTDAHVDFIIIPGFLDQLSLIQVLAKIITLGRNQAKHIQQLKNLGTGTFPSVAVGAKECGADCEKFGAGIQAIGGCFACGGVKIIDAILIVIILILSYFIAVHLGYLPQFSTSSSSSSEKKESLIPYRPLLTQ